MALTFRNMNRSNPHVHVKFEGFRYVSSDKACNERDLNINCIRVGPHCE